MTGGLKGGGCPTFLEGSGGVSRGIFVISGCTPLGLDGAPRESASLAKELLELVSLRPKIKISHILDSAINLLTNELAGFKKRYEKTFLSIKKIELEPVYHTVYPKTSTT